MPVNFKSFFPLLLFILCIPLQTLAGQPQDQFTFILPAPALHKAIQNILPLPLEPKSSSFTGNLSIDAIDTLRIQHETISLHGVISGKNMTMSTEIAGQTIQLKLGQLTLPVTCDLRLRFDQDKQQLFVTPVFKTSQDKNVQSGEALLPLLTSLGSQEYPIDLSKLQSFNPVIGQQPLSLKLKTIHVTAEKNQLVLGLQPQ